MRRTTLRFVHDTADQHCKQRLCDAFLFLGQGSRRENLTRLRYAPHPSAARPHAHCNRYTELPDDGSTLDSVYTSWFHNYTDMDTDTRNLLDEFKRVPRVRATRYLTMQSIVYTCCSHVNEEQTVPMGTSPPAPGRAYFRVGTFP